MPLADGAHAALRPELGHRPLKGARLLAHFFSQRDDRFAWTCTNQCAQPLADFIELRCCPPLRRRPRCWRPNALASRWADRRRRATQRARKGLLRGLTDFVDIRRDQRLDRVRELFGRAWGSHVPHIALDVCPFNTPGERLRLRKPLSDSSLGLFQRRWASPTFATLKSGGAMDDRQILKDIADRDRERARAERKARGQFRRNVMDPPPSKSNKGCMGPLVVLGMMCCLILGRRSVLRRPNEINWQPPRTDRCQGLACHLISNGAWGSRADLHVGHFMWASAPGSRTLPPLQLALQIRREYELHYLAGVGCGGF